MNRRPMGMVAALAMLMAGSTTKAEKTVLSVDPDAKQATAKIAGEQQAARARWRSGAAFMGPLDLDRRGRQRQRARQTHPGKRGKR